MLYLWLGPPGFNCQISFTPVSSICCLSYFVYTVESLSLFYLLLYLDLYALGDDTSLS